MIRPDTGISETKTRGNESMAAVHPTATLSRDVHLGDDVEIGPNCVISGRVTIGDGTRLIAGVYLEGPLTLGERCTLYPNVCLGFAPQHTKYDPKEPGQGLLIGNDNIFREGATIHRAFADELPTTIGDHNYFMTNSHAGHDCRIGNDCTFVTGCALGGHCHVEDRVIIGGMSVVHQHCRIGEGAMLSGGMGTSADLPPWFMLTGYNITGAVNLIGLRRSGFSREEIESVRWVYRVLYREDRTIKAALEVLRERSAEPMVKKYIDFIESSDRPLVTAKPKSVRGAG